MPRVRAAADVLLQEEGGDAFLLHVASGRYFGLNRTGLVIWKAVVEGREPLAAVADRWPDVPADQREREVEALVSALLGAGLAEPTDG